MKLNFLIAALLLGFLATAQVTTRRTKGHTDGAGYDYTPEELETLSKLRARGLDSAKVCAGVTRAVINCESKFTAAEGYPECVNAGIKKATEGSVPQLASKTLNQYRMAADKSFKENEITCRSCHAEPQYKNTKPGGPNPEFVEETKSDAELTKELSHVRELIGKEGFLANHPFWK